MKYSRALPIFQGNTSATTLLLASTVFLSACGGNEEGAGYCISGFIGGQQAISSMCTGCTVDTLPAVADDIASTSARLTFPPGGGRIVIRATARDNTAIPSSNTAGALMRFPAENLTNVGVTFSLYRNGVAVATSSGGSLTVSGQVSGAGSDTYYGDASSTVPFDAVEANVSLQGNTQSKEVLLKEICSVK